MTAGVARRIVLAAVLLVTGAGIWLVVRVHGILAPFALAGVLVYLIAPLVERLHRRGLGRPWAILVSYALVGLLGAGLLTLALPDLIRELVRLGDLLPAYAARIDAAVRNLRQGEAGRLPAPVQQAVVVAVGHLQGRAEAAIRSATSGLLAIVGGLLAIILAPFLAYYLLADLPRFHDRLLAAVPPGARPAFLAYVRDLDAMLSGFVRGQLLTAATIGALVAAAMVLLRLRYALTLGFVAGLGELVPYFGPFVGSLPGLALAGAHSWRLLLEVGIAYAVIQQIESAIVHPYIVGHATGLHPLTVVFALLAGGELAGLPGLIFGVPAAGVVQVTGIHLVRAAVAWRRVAAEAPLPGSATGEGGPGGGAIAPPGGAPPERARSARPGTHAAGEGGGAASGAAGAGAGSGRASRDGTSLRTSAAGAGGAASVAADGAAAASGAGERAGGAAGEVEATGGAAGQTSGGAAGGRAWARAGAAEAGEVPKGRTGAGGGAAGAAGVPGAAAGGAPALPAPGGAQGHGTAGARAEAGEGG